MAKHTRKTGWSYTAGERGRNRVRVYERSGVVWLDLHDETGKRIRSSLGHDDRDRAKRQADEVAARVAKGSLALRADDLRVGPLFDKYLNEVTPAKGTTTQEHDRMAAKLFEGHWGRDCKVRTLDREDWDGFIRERRSGRLRPGGSRGGKVGARTVQRDLRWVVAVFHWAETLRDTEGERLLFGNPFKGLPFPKEENPRRPIVSETEYRAMLRVAGQVDWRAEAALILAWETGHRISAILRLRWADVSPDFSAIRRRAENDKLGMEHVVPITCQAAAALRAVQEVAPGIGEAWVFPSVRREREPSGYDEARYWWRRMVTLAGITPTARMGWHAMRRRFATDLKDIPLPDLARLGGWKSTDTILQCYQMADEDTMKAALDQRRRKYAGGA